MSVLQRHKLDKGPSIKYVTEIFGIFDPLPPLVRILARFVRLNSRNLPYYVRFWAPSPSLRTYFMDAPLFGRGKELCDFFSSVTYKQTWHI